MSGIKQGKITYSYHEYIEKVSVSNVLICIIIIIKKQQKLLAAATAVNIQ